MLHFFSHGASICLMKVREVLDYYGSQQGTARALGIAQGAVSRWVQQDRVPELRQAQIELLTEGRLRADLLQRDAQPRVDGRTLSSFIRGAQRIDASLEDYAALLLKQARERQEQGSEE